MKGQNPKKSILFLENLFDILASLLLLGGILGEFGCDQSLKINLQTIAGRHQVVIIDHLDERLDTSATGDLLGAHRLGHLEWVTLDTDDQGTSKLSST